MYFKGDKYKHMGFIPTCNRDMLLIFRSLSVELRASQNQLPVFSARVLSVTYKTWLPKSQSTSTSVTSFLLSTLFQYPAPMTARHPLALGPLR